MLNNDHCRPTAVAWPSALRRKLDIPKVEANAAESCDEDLESDEESHLQLQHRKRTTSPISSFSSNQLRSYIHISYNVLSSLQRQLYRGEESYFEETYSHGNLFTGWDNIWIDANSTTGLTDGTGPVSIGDGNVGSNIGSSAPSKAASSRKMPHDYRWFSSSCTISPTGTGQLAAILSRESLTNSPSNFTIKKNASLNLPSSATTIKESFLKQSSSKSSEAQSEHFESIELPMPAYKKVRIENPKLDEAKPTVASNPSRDETNIISSSNNDPECTKCD